MFADMQPFDIALVIGGTLLACVALAAYLGWRI